MLAIVDAYDAMTSDRPYRRAMSQEEAIAELRRCSGQQFDPYLVSRFASMVESEALAPLPPAAIRGA
jgi:HD-GYP domain-containing protein (c-di-GMP phosphodiesterase class II)